MMDAISHFSRKCIAIEERPQNSYVVITCDLRLRGWPDGDCWGEELRHAQRGEGVWFPKSP